MIIDWALDYMNRVAPDKWIILSSNEMELEDRFARKIQKACKELRMNLFEQRTKTDGFHDGRMYFVNSRNVLRLINQRKFVEID